MYSIFNPKIILYKSLFLSICIFSIVFQLEYNVNFLSNSLNFSIDPCNDFYDYACGSWITNNNISKNNDEVSVFGNLSDDVNKELRTILLSNTSWMGHTDSTLPIHKARLFYKSCIDEKKIEEVALSPIPKYVDLLKLNPFCESGFMGNSSSIYLNDSWNMFETFKYLQQNFFPSTAFFDVDAVSDYQNNSGRIIKIEDYGTSLQQEIYNSNAQVVDSYKKYVHKLFEELEFSCDDLNEIIDGVLNLEHDIANFKNEDSSNNNDDYHRITIEELTWKIPDFPWLSHLRDVFNDTLITLTDKILVTSTSRLYYIVNIMNNTPKRIFIAYLIWHNLRDRVVLLNKKIRILHQNFKNDISSAKHNIRPRRILEEEEETPRSTYCTDITNTYFGIAIAGDFILNNFKEAELNKAKKVIGEVIEAMKNRIKQNSWLDDKTISKSIEKMEALSSKVGYPEYIFNLTYLISRYKHLEIKEDEFFFNNVRLDQYYRRKYLGKLRKPVEKSKWSMLPQTVNAMYQFFHNDISIPAGILRPPFFYSSDNLPRSLNYGAIGSVIGHEITHAFDSTGRKFDKNGLIVKEWWSGGSVHEFNQRSICFQEQYSKYQPNGKLFINGKQTLAENIADNGGVLASLEAYKKLNIPSNTTFNIKGHDLTDLQLFFIAFAQEYCSKGTFEYNEMEILVQSHTPAKYRVIGTLSNIPNFSEAFKCATGTPMNPGKKCCIW